MILTEGKALEIGMKAGRNDLVKERLSRAKKKGLLSLLLALLLIPSVCLEAQYNLSVFSLFY